MGFSGETARFKVREVDAALRFSAAPLSSRPKTKKVN